MDNVKFVVKFTTLLSNLLIVYEIFFKENLFGTLVGW